MDPDMTLKWIRGRIRDIDTVADVDCEDTLYFLAEEISALDDWLSKGGFLPKDWAR